MDKDTPFTSALPIGAWPRVPDRFVGHDCGCVLGGVGGLFYWPGRSALKFRRRVNQGNGRGHTAFRKESAQSVVIVVGVGWCLSIELQCVECAKQYGSEELGF